MSIAPFAIGLGAITLLLLGKKKASEPASLVTADEEEQVMSQDPDVFKGTIYANFVRPSLPGYRYARQNEIPSSLMSGIRAHLSRPLGSVAHEEHGGKQFALVIEPHYHPPGGTARPWGPHKGVSVYILDGSSLE